MLVFGLNQVTLSEMPFDAFLDTAARLGCAGVELRNDLGRPFFDGNTPEAARRSLARLGLRCFGLSQVYPFNRWSAEIRDEMRALLDTAHAVGAETINLIPANDGTGLGADERERDLVRALEGYLPLLETSEVTALIEPLGFGRASLRHKSEIITAIDAVGASARVKIVHDTFHHALTGGGAVFADRTGIVHVSGVEVNETPLDHMEDADRVLVGPKDRLNTVRQVQALSEDGYTGPVSFECFSPLVRTAEQPFEAIKASMNFISSHLQQDAA